MYRLYIVPIETYQPASTLYRGPKYFKWRFSDQCDPVTSIPELVNVAWGNLHYGAEDIMIIAADVTTAQHTLIAEQSDVIAAPENLDQVITAEEVQALRVYCQSNQLPHFTDDTMTYRQALRIYAGVFIFVQRLDGMSKKRFSEFGFTMQTQWKNMSTEAEQAFLGVASSFDNPLDVSGIKNNDKIETILSMFGEQFDDWNYQLGGYTL